MLMTNFLQKRKSVRNFTENVVPKDILENIKLLMAEIDESESDVKFTFYENGKIISDGLDGKAGYDGVMIKSPHYIALEIKDNNAINLLKGGFYLEKLNTKIVDLDVDTCWITVDQVDADTKKTIFGQGGEGIDFLIGLGYGVKKKLFDPEVTSPRLKVEDIIFKDNIGIPISIEELENYGIFDVFSSVRYAPSHKNLQPWRFVLEAHTVKAFMVKTVEDSRSFVDMGVVLFYVQEMMKSININNKWEVEIKEDGDYYYIGSFNI